MVQGFSKRVRVRCHGVDGSTLSELRVEGAFLYTGGWFFLRSGSRGMCGWSRVLSLRIKRGDRQYKRGLIEETRKRSWLWSFALPRPPFVVQKIQRTPSPPLNLRRIPA